MNIRNLSIHEYNYHLPDDRIAKYPAQNRDESKLLYFNQGKIDTFQFKQLPDLLQSDDLLIFNNAKVIQARLNFTKETGAQIEIFCLEPHLPSDYNLAFQVKGRCQWKCLVGNFKKWKSGKLSKKLVFDNVEYMLEAFHIGKTSNAEIIEFSWYLSENQSKLAELSFGEILENNGLTPLPPYLNRKAEKSDKDRYQTIYAKQRGSVAAPTAGLHFTADVLKSINEKGIKKGNVTLHVSAGTFRPVKSQTIEEHDMHEEHFEIDRKTLALILGHSGRVISVGTTSARTLESIYWIGVRLFNKKDIPFNISQWEAYEQNNPIDFKESLSSILKYMDENKIDVLKASTRIMIVPGYQFKSIQGLITNFHQPQSTLLLLIAAAVGEKWYEIYEYALANEYRFLSYGDSSLLIFP